jgi:acetyl esterase/lipase
VVKLDEEIQTVLTELGSSVTEFFVPRADSDWKPLVELVDMLHDSLAADERRTHVTIDRYNIPAEDGMSIPLRIYRRAGSEPSAVLLYFHGAGILGRSIDVCDGICRRYAFESDVAVAALEYRLGSEDDEIGPVEDCHAALVWLAEYSAHLGFDPARIGVAGDGAGGSLAAGTSLLAKERGGPQPALQMLVYPMLDDRHEVPDWAKRSGIQWAYEFNALVWRMFIGSSAGGPDVPAHRAPARAVDLSDLPRAYLEVGELDTVRQDSEEYAARLREAGVEAELHVMPGAPHGFDLVAPRSSLTRRAFAERLRLLSSL